MIRPVSQVTAFVVFFASEFEEIGHPDAMLSVGICFYFPPSPIVREHFFPPEGWEKQRPSSPRNNAVCAVFNGFRIEEDSSIPEKTLRVDRVNGMVSSLGLHCVCKGCLAMLSCLASLAEEGHLETPDHDLEGDQTPRFRGWCAVYRDFKIGAASPSPV